MCRYYSDEAHSKLTFGGKLLILLGDPGQLPPVHVHIYDNDLFMRFEFYVLKEIVR
jgi:hypothetical protein